MALVARTLTTGSESRGDACDHHWRALTVIGATTAYSTDELYWSESRNFQHDSLVLLHDGTIRILA